MDPSPDDFVPYDENNLAHQESPLAISEWQEWNDISGATSLWIKEGINPRDESRPRKSLMWRVGGEKRP